MTTACVGPSCGLRPEHEAASDWLTGLIGLEDPWPRITLRRNHRRGKATLRGVPKDRPFSTAEVHLYDVYPGQVRWLRIVRVTIDNGCPIAWGEVAIDGTQWFRRGYLYPLSMLDLEVVRAME